MAAKDSKPFWRHIYGFRSVTTWKMVVASILYFGVVVIGITGALVFSLNSKAAAGSDDNRPVITNGQLPDVKVNPDKYAGYPAILVGKIFGPTSVDGDHIIFQMWGDPKIADYDLAIEGPTSSPAVEGGEYVRVTGHIGCKATGTSGVNAKNTAIDINADKVERISSIDDLAPIKVKREFQRAISQFGYEITLKSVEFTDTETRVYLAVKNETGQKIKFYPGDARAIQAGTKFKSETACNYPGIQSEMLPNGLSEGVVVFGALDPNEPVEFHFEGSCQGYSENFQPYIFVVNDDGN